jgi:SWI/SNF-related matrix-associated actin-dependent regulator 1 of chromatin subfamily A
MLTATALCLGYLLPHVSRRRSIDAELPVEDRFSTSARVIDPPTEPTPAGRSSTALLAGTHVQRTATMQRPATSRPITPARPIKPLEAAADSPASPQRAKSAQRARQRPGQPAGRSAHESAAAAKPVGPAPDAAARPSAHPASLAESRARAARLRASLLIGFTLLAVCALGLTITAGLNPWAAAVCAALAASVLVAGRIAVVAEQRADAARAVPSPKLRPASGTAGGAANVDSKGSGSEARANAAAAGARADATGGGERARTAARADAAGARAGAARTGARAGAAAAGSEARADAAGATADLGAEGLAGGASETRGRPGYESGPADSRTRPGRRPAIPGRSRARGAFKLPEPLEIKAVSAEELTAAGAGREPVASANGRRRMSPARPKLVLGATEQIPKAAALPQGEPISADQPEASAPTRRQPGDPVAPEVGQAGSGPAAKGATWTPRGVPAPSYTLMSGAPRWEPKPLTATDFAQARRAAAQATQRAAAEARAEGLETAATGEIPIPGRVIFSDGALDLDRAIAARRRAAASN